MHKYIYTPIPNKIWQLSEWQSPKTLCSHKFTS